MHEELEKWVNEQWGDCDLGDNRRNKRTVKIAQSIIKWII